MSRLLALVVAFTFVGCGSARPDSPASASDGAYGMSADAPILVGLERSEGSGGPARERAYLERLRGPRGAPVSYERQGSCCAFSTPNGMMNRGLLDMYEVWGAGLDGRVTLYLNMYDPPSDEEVDRAPPGLTLLPSPEG